MKMSTDPQRLARALRPALAPLQVAARCTCGGRATTLLNWRITGHAETCEIVRWRDLERGVA